MCSNIERIDRRTYENTHNWNSFGKKHSITERITQTADDCKIYRQNKYSILQRRMTATLSLTKADNMLYRNHG